MLNVWKRIHKDRAARIVRVVVVSLFNAQGKELDDFGVQLGLARNDGEDDAAFRFALVLIVKEDIIKLGDGLRNPDAIVSQTIRQRHIDSLSNVLLCIPRREDETEKQHYSRMFLVVESWLADVERSGC